MQASLNFNATSCEQFNKTIQLHKDPIESEIQGQVSKFHFLKKVQQKKLNRDHVMFKAYSAAYWLV